MTYFEYCLDAQDTSLGEEIGSGKDLKIVLVWCGTHVYHREVSPSDFAAGRSASHAPAFSFAFPGPALGHRRCPTTIL